MRLADTPQGQLVLALAELAADGIEIRMMADPDTRVEIKPGDAVIREDSQAVAELDALDCIYLMGLLVTSAVGMPTRPAEGKKGAAV